MTKILIIDDSKEDATQMEGLLTKAGYLVKITNSGADGLAELQNNEFKLVILDMFMPEMSGREVCEKIRDNANLKSIKVIFVTAAHFSEKGKKEIEELKCAADYITKPFDEKDFINRVKKVLGA